MRRTSVFTAGENLGAGAALPTPSISIPKGGDRLRRSEPKTKGHPFGCPFVLAPPARLELTTFRLGGGPSILVRYGGIYRNYSIIQDSGIRTIRFLGGGPSIPVRYGGIYRKYSILQGSRVRTVRLLGGGRSTQLSHGGIRVSGLWYRRMGTVSFYPVPGCLSTVEMTEAGRAA